MEARLGPLRAEGAEPTSSPVLEHLRQLPWGARSPSQTALPPPVFPLLPPVCWTRGWPRLPRSREAPTVSPVSWGQGAGVGLMEEGRACWLPGTGPALPPGATGPLAGCLSADPLFTPSQVSLPSSEGFPQVQALLRTPEACASVSLPRLPPVGPQNSFSLSALLTSEARSSSVHWGMGFLVAPLGKRDLSSLSRD